MKTEKKWLNASRYNLLRNRLVDESMPMDARWLWMILDSFNDKQGNPKVRPPLCKILKRAGIGRTKFYELRTLLCEKGWIEACERIGPDGKQTTTEYRTVHDWTGIENCSAPVCRNPTAPPCRETAPLDMTYTNVFRIEDAPRFREA